MFLNPNEILNQVGLTKEMVAADFGSGSGGWSIPLAKILRDGQVSAIDVQEEPLSALVGEARAQGVRNITTIVADLEQKVPGLVSESCDFILISNVLFQADDRLAILREAYRALKPGGWMLAVEWRPEAPMGPKGLRLTVGEVEELARGTGFNLEKEIPAGLYHFALLFKKL
ncbi:MAG: class I SAM-dependent methyltransferase [Candidatus Pacebacteria bacterium]|nr:class I SAM-dependent methyltransferase [Candidatus Paceibacterota bacterium]